MINHQEIEAARHSLEYALSQGAQAVRITLTKSTEDLISTLDGVVDTVTRCADRSMSIALFVDGRFGSFSINRMDIPVLEDFILKAIETVRMFAPDPLRKLPEPGRCCHNAQSGRELDIYDEAYETLTPEDRVRMALDAAVTGRTPRGVRLVSEEGEYSDSEYDTYLIDSQGVECRQRESSFEYGVEVTIEDEEGNKYSDYWWTASPRLADFDASSCGITAIEHARAQIGSEPAESGKYNMVVAAEAASKLVTPLLNALNAYSIQQGNSFLKGSLGEKLLSPGLTIMDEPWRKGESGSKLFDGEGVATRQEAIIDSGTVMRYSVNTYMSGKLEMEPTVEDVIRPRLAPWPSPGLDRDALMRMCGDGILVTDFNGGNCNMTTGDFSYGISGQVFKDGRIVKPVSEMLITGNFLDLWNHLLAAGEDYRLCFTRLIPSIAFSEVDFSG